MRQFIVVLLVVAMLVCIAAPVFAGSAGLWGGCWLNSHTTLDVINEHLGYGGPKVGNSWHYNFVIYHHRYWYDWWADDKWETNNFHITFYGKPRQICVYIWDNHNPNSDWDRCVRIRNFDDLSETIRDAIASATGIVVAWWVADTLAWLILPLALA